MEPHAQVARRGRDVPHVAGLLGGAQVHRAPSVLRTRIRQEGRGTHRLRIRFGGGRGGGAAYEQLAAHTQVGRQGAAVIQRQPQELPPPDGRGDGASGEPVDEGLCSPVLAAQGTRVEDLDTGDRASDDVPGEPGAHNLDLWELGHQLCWECWESC